MVPGRARAVDPRAGLRRDSARQQWGMQGSASAAARGQVVPVRGGRPAATPCSDRAFDAVLSFSAGQAHRVDARVRVARHRARGQARRGRVTGGAARPFSLCGSRSTYRTASGASHYVEALTADPVRRAGARAPGAVGPVRAPNPHSGPLRHLVTCLDPTYRAFSLETGDGTPISLVEPNEADRAGTATKAQGNT